MARLAEGWIFGRKSEVHCESYGTAYRMLVKVCKDKDSNVFRIGEEEKCVIMLEWVSHSFIP